MTTAATNKHATRSARTRQHFVESAQALFAERGIDSVSLNEITVAAGQKNRNALQYHFGNREGLLQAIIDQHAGAVADLRKAYAEQAEEQAWSAPETSARLLVMPMADYIEDHPQGVHYVRILSQLAAMNSSLINPATTSRLSFRKDDYLRAAMSRALSHLGAEEAQQRLFLAVSITFHTLADICRASEAEDTAPALQRRSELFDQLVGGIAAILSAPART